mgnify:CR=1 FL=1
MLWVISGGLILVIAAIWIVLLRLLWRERGEKWHWKIEASTYLSRARTWQAQAEAFEAAGKTLEEHAKKGLPRQTVKIRCSSGSWTNFGRAAALRTHPLQSMHGSLQTS